MEIALDKIEQYSREVENQLRYIEKLRKESAEWNLTEHDIVVDVAHMLHEDCRLDHTEHCGFYYSNQNSYFDRAEKIIKWCKDNEIKIDFMMRKHKPELKKMFK